MSGVFEHSIKVPRLYKTVAKIVQTVREDGASLKQLVYLKQHPNIKALYALALTSLQHASQLDQLIRRTKILVNEPRLDPWLARVLITELLWGKKHLSSECKPVLTVLAYEKLLKDELKNTESFVNPENKLKVEKPRYVRVNTLSMSVEEAIESFKEEGWRQLHRSKDYVEFIESVSKLSGAAFIQDIHVPELLIFPAKTQFYNHAGYISGSIILQDKASCLPAYLLDARPGSTVLDMCAAPGMKTTHLAAMLNNKGKIYAVEIDKRRYQTLCEIVASTNSHCVETINADVMTLDARQCHDVEYILVDPSCSGSGMLDRLDIDSNTEKCAPGRLKNLQSFQVIILRHALLNFPKAKRIVYSTCSLYPEENEQVIDDVISQVGDAYKLVSAKTLMNENWLNYSSTDYNCKDNCLYARPETDLSNGFFVAVFERNFDAPLPDIKRKKNKLGADTIKGQNGVESSEIQSNKKDKKKKQKHSNEHASSNENGGATVTLGSEEITADYGTVIQGGTDVVRKKKKKRAKDFDVTKNAGAEENSQNDCDKVNKTEEKISKRKHKHSVSVETIVENCDELSTKKKKCKKSRTEDKEIDSDALRGDEESVKKKVKKSKKQRDRVETEDDAENESKHKVSNDQVDKTAESADSASRKKRKKRKV
ncbi:28S rRNA (cytosine-C(5))-methyltransferase [Neodiprion lecontei]|uniref:28S rRNA (Cytosine-C(5))-methyltransferase n=1 Tax=Neodiprion lecontei TaxID=441921 RepID=A0A6J0BNL5_NEOLC|nr:28S rRNA (cytosine-C(5))-methyltransferase [Neodiprion lecontei]